MDNRSTNKKIISNNNQRFINISIKNFINRKIFFLVPITFHGDSIQYAAFGEAVVIKCHVQASPAAEVSWFKGQEKTRIGLFIITIF